MESHPLECLIRANEAGLLDLRDKAALKTLDMTVEAAVSVLKNSANWTFTFAAWVSRTAYSPALSCIQFCPNCR